MKDLNKYVIPKVAMKWYDLGLKLLNSRQELLETIEKDFLKDGSEICCRKMFIKWLGTCDASWEELIEAAIAIEQLLSQGKCTVVRRHLSIFEGYFRSFANSCFSL